MAKYESDDRHLWPGSDVLVNLLGITDQTELDAAEATLVLLATVELGQSPLAEPAQGPDFTYFLAIHRALFRDIYSWAGSTREVDISKGNSRFANWRYIDAEGQRICGLLAAENWLNHLAEEQFSARLAWYMGELNVLHPFRDGNGRALREYIRYLAARAGHPLSWDGVTPEEMLRSSISAYRGDTSELAALLLRQIQAESRSERPLPFRATDQNRPKK